LIDGGEDLLEKDVLSKTPIDWAAFNGDVDVLKAIRSRALSSNTAVDYDKALFGAITWKNTEAALWLIDNGANLSRESVDGDTYLIAAVDRELLNVVVRLIDRGVNIHQRDRAGYTPLMKSAQYRDSRITQLLLSKGASISDSARDNTALSLAVYFQHVETARLLVSHGANFKLLSESNETMLMRAAKTPNVEMIEFLLNMGLDINARDKSGKNALFFALESDRVDVAGLLVNRGIAVDVYSPDGTTPALIAAMHGYMDMMTSLVRRGNAYVLSSSTPDRAFASAYVARAFAEKHREEQKIANSIGAYRDANELLTKLVQFYTQADASPKSNGMSELTLVVWVGLSIAAGTMPYLLGVGIGNALLDASYPARVEVAVHRNLLPRNRELVGNLAKQTFETIECLSAAKTQEQISACPA